MREIVDRQFMVSTFEIGKHRRETALAETVAVKRAFISEAANLFTSQINKRC